MFWMVKFSETAFTTKETNELWLFHNMNVWLDLDLVQALWWSTETWSRSRDSSRDTFIRVSVSKVLGLVSVSEATGLSHRPVALKLSICQLQQYGLTKLLQFNVFLCLLHLQVRNNTSRSEKCQKFEKISTWK